MQAIATFLSGLLFGLGLVVSGLINPAKVLNFLDVAGTWDASLALTMAAAVVTTAARLPARLREARTPVRPATSTFRPRPPSMRG